MTDGLPVTLPAATAFSWKEKPCRVVTAVRSGRWMLTTRSERGGRRRSTGSLSMGAPAGIVAEALPPNVTGRSVSGAVSVPEDPARNATRTSPMRSGEVPASLVSRSRTRSPPTLVCTTWRTVSSSRIGVADSGVAVGTAAQVPTQLRGPPGRWWPGSAVLAAAPALSSSS
ncbi:hypothetical protein ACFQZU_22785, partial [Streptomonospora algeriensis]